MAEALVPDRRWRWILAAAAFLSLLLYAVIFRLSPMNGEDYALARPLGSTGATWAWILARSAVQIGHWNARLGEQLSIFWLAQPQGWFLAAALLVFLALNVLLALLVSGSRGLAEKAGLCLGLVFLLWPRMEVFFWRTAEAGYLQPMVLTLYCLYWYSSDEALESLAASRIRLLLVSLVACLAGLSFENVPPAGLAYMAGSLALCRDRRARLVGLLPALALGLGWALLLTAPSTALRRAHYDQLFGVKAHDAAYAWGRIRDVARVFWASSRPLACAAAAAALYLARQSPRLPRLPLAALAAALVVASVVAAPYTEPRAFLLAWCLMLAVVMEALHVALGRHAWVRPAVVVLLLGSLGCQVWAYGLYSDFARRVSSRESAILAQPSASVALAPLGGDYDPRYLNNRDEWCLASPMKVYAYFGRSAGKP